MATLSKDLTSLMQDPRWKDVEAIIHNKIDPLMDFHSIDTTQPAEHVKAEIIARRIAYDSLADFLNETLLVERKIKKNNNPFV